MKGVIVTAGPRNYRITVGVALATVVAALCVCVDGAVAAVPHGENVAASSSASSRSTTATRTLHLTDASGGTPTTFLAMWNGFGEGGGLEMFSATSGAPLGEVVTPRLAKNSYLSSPNRAGRGSLWWTTVKVEQQIETSIPSVRPNSCNITISTQTVNSDRVSVVYHAPPSLWVSDVVPNSSGHQFAYFEGPCTTSPVNTDIAVHSRTSDRTYVIGGRLANCHYFSTPSWSSNGSQLTFAYLPSAGQLNATAFPLGGCPQPKPGEIVVAPANDTGPIGASEVTMAHPGCGYEDSAFDATGIVAIETCGRIQNLRAYLVQLNDARHVVLKVLLKPHPDGMSLTVSPNGKFVLINEYEARALRNGMPVCWVWDFNGTTLGQVGRYAGAGEIVNSAIW
jgi:hypothetical protein